MSINNSKAIKNAVAKFEKLIEKKDPNQIMRYPEIFSMFSWYHVGKQEARRVLVELEKSGKIKNIPFHGVRFVGGK